ncbi:MAG: YrhK family protein, partial [Nocardioidaceae bacterium]
MSEDLGSQPAQTSRRWLGSFLREFPWIHLFIGLSGNLLFFVGSIMFFSKRLETGAIWLFVIGSLGMLVGSLG